ncbi:MAG: hypothetical protein R3C19_02705 [Planctomycetaceae bacterium]
MTTTGLANRGAALAALALGVLAGILLAGWSAVDDDALQAALKEYEHLTPEDRDSIRSRQTTVFADMPAEDRQRFSKLHDAISRDAELKVQLDRLYAWWVTLDPASRDELMELKQTSPDDWVTTIQSQYHNDMLLQATDEIVVDFRQRDPSDRDRQSSDATSDSDGKNSRVIRFSVSQYAGFLDAVAPADRLEPLQQQKLSKLDRETDRLLFRSLWLSSAMMEAMPRRGGPPGPPPDNGGTEPVARQPRVDGQFVMQSLLSELVDSEHRTRIEAVRSDMQQSFLRFGSRPGGGRGSRGNDGRSRSENDNVEWQRIAIAVSTNRVVFAFLEAANNHLGEDFKSEHMPEATSLAAVFDSLPVAEQHEMMFMDADDARQRLRQQAIVTSADSGEVVNELAAELNDFQDRMRDIRRMSRPWGGRPSRNDDPGFSGRRGRGAPRWDEGPRPNDGSGGPAPGGPFAGEPPEPPIGPPPE